MRIISIVLLCWWLPLYGLAQQIPVVKYGTADGLGHPIVYRVFQDSSHLLWFGTDNGLTRYDGRQFKNFTSQDGFRSSFVFSITARENKLLCCTFGGGLQYLAGAKALPDTLALQQIKYPLNVTHYKGGLWVVDKNHRYFFLNGNECRTYVYPLTNKRQIMQKILQHDGQLYGISVGLMMFNEATDSFEENPTGTFIDNVNIFNAISLKDGRLLMATVNGLAIRNANHTVRLLADIPFSYNTGNLYQLANGTVLVGSSDGSLWLFNKTLTASKKLLTGVVVNDITEDDWGHIWLCTYGQGVWKLPSLAVQQYPLENLISPNIYWDAATREARVFSFNGQEYIISHKNGTVKRFIKANQKLLVGYASYFVNNNGERLFTTSSTIVKEKGTTKQLLHNTSTTITQLYQDSDNQYWVAQKPGLLTGSDFASLRPVAAFAKTIVRCVTEGPSKIKYIGTDDGLYIAAPSGIRHITAAHGLKNLFVTSLFYDGIWQKLWIGTNDGLYSLNGDGSVNPVLADLRINDIACDRNGNKWMATSWGLVLYNQKYFQVFGEEDGLQSNLIKLAYDSTAHQLHVLASENYYAISLYDYVSNNYRNLPQIKLMQQKINGVLLPDNSFIHEVPEKINQLFLEIAVPMYHSLLGYKLYYRVNSGTWVNANWATELNISNLYYGQHVVEIKVEDEINHITATSIKLTYHVQTPFWKTTTALVLLFLLALLTGLMLLALAWRYLNRRRIRHIKAEQRRMELEHKVLGNMLNPHFMNNALNAIQAFVAKNDQRNTLGYLAKFARLMRINLELLEKNSITLDKEIQNLSLYLEFELLRNPALIEYFIEVEPGIDLTHITVPSLLLQPFVENAIWHGILPKKEKGTIRIGVSRQPLGICITIADDGVGLEAARNNAFRHSGEKTSKGLQIIADRLALLNVTRPGHRFQIDSNQPNGTLVTVTIPL